MGVTRGSSNPLGHGEQLHLPLLAQLRLLQHEGGDGGAVARRLMKGAQSD